MRESCHKEIITAVFFNFFLILLIRVIDGTLFLSRFLTITFRFQNGFSKPDLFGLNISETDRKVNHVYLCYSSEELAHTVYSNCRIDELLKYANSVGRIFQLNPLDTVTFSYST